MEDIISTRDNSTAMEDDGSSGQTNGLYAPHLPTLPEVLSNSAPYPWTRSAFTAYLSQNHCLENLEFTMDAERYRGKHDALAAQMAGMPISSDMEDCIHVRMLWQRLLDAYIIVDGPREINIPSDVRDRLLSLSNHTIPPPPEELDSAVQIVYKLMEESVLISFLNEAPPTSTTSTKSRPIKYNAADVVLRKRGGSDSSQDRKCGRSKSRRRASPTSSLDAMFSSSDPTGRLTPASHLAKSHRTPSNNSGGSGDLDLLTDDSNSISSPGREPMTPPHTPPSSEFGGASPKQRSDIGWKKMLGWKKKPGSGSRDFRHQHLDE